jgi:hypothetical protein
LKKFALFLWLSKEKKKTRNLWDGIGSAFLIVASILDLGKPFLKIAHFDVTFGVFLGMLVFFFFFFFFFFFLISDFLMECF